jgi:23S rRNA (uracil1939-C5)-methyltransferase
MWEVYLACNVQPETSFPEKIMSKSPKASKTLVVTIEKLVYGGAGFGRHQGKVIFVPFSAPGDRLLVRPVEEKKTFIRAKIIRILKPGRGRVAPVCPYFGKCGGCQWQQLEYARQVEAKRQILEEIFHHRFPQTHEIPITMKACPHPYGYRSRARVQLRGSGFRASVGFFRCGSHSVEDIESCPLFRPSLNEALSSLRQYKLRVDTDARSQEMDIACSEEEGTWATARTGAAVREGITTLMGTRRREDVILRRRIGEFLYFVTAHVFFQANDFMISELVELVRKCAKNAGRKSALDLFAGVGLFSLPLALQFEKTIAVEDSSSASRLCLSNAKAAGLSNIQPICSGVSAWMESVGVPAHPKFDLIVLDPPRTGAGPAIMGKIKDWAPKSILYVSCAPLTLSRDLAQISPLDYRIDLVAGLDMFPQTYHFETVVHLSRK